MNEGDYRKPIKKEEKYSSKKIEQIVSGELIPYLKLTGLKKSHYILYFRENLKTVKEGYKKTLLNNLKIILTSEFRDKPIFDIDIHTRRMMEEASKIIEEELKTKKPALLQDNS